METITFIMFGLAVLGCGFGIRERIAREEAQLGADIWRLEFEKQCTFAGQWMDRAAAADRAIAAIKIQRLAALDKANAVNEAKRQAQQAAKAATTANLISDAARA